MTTWLSSGTVQNAGVVGIHEVLARAFPAEPRATGSGFVRGTGRGGTVIAPIVAGADDDRERIVERRLRHDVVGGRRVAHRSD